MARSWLSRVVSASFLGAGLASCTLLTGVSDLTVVDAIDAEVAEAAPQQRPDTGPVVVTPPVDSGPDVAPPRDAEVGADADATVVCGAECLDVPPPPFELVALGPKTAACPSDFGPFSDLVEDPVVGAGACPCTACNVTNQPSCPSTGAMPTMFDDTIATGFCGSPGGTTSAACSDDGYLGPFGATNEHRYTPPPGGPTGGSCTGSVSKDSSKLSVTALRSCKAAGSVPKCEEKVCPKLAAPFVACVSASGDLACPAGFPDKHRAGTGAAFNCTNGTCGCSLNTGTCSGGKLNFYAAVGPAGGACSGTPAMVVNVNNTCVPTVSTPAGEVYAAHKYIPNAPSNVSCNPNGAGAPAQPTLLGPTTICCR